jgi:hypothetical protein
MFNFHSYLTKRSNFINGYRKNLYIIPKTNKYEISSFKVANSVKRSAPDGTNESSKLSIVSNNISMFCSFRQPVPKIEARVFKVHPSKPA